jgi:phage terminase Nu1 subunit (DNA packaging protein)
MTASQQCKVAGLNSLAQLADITKISVRTLSHWHKTSQPKFTMAIDAALHRLSKSESLQG